MLTPYQFAGNNPVAGIDLDGREFEWFMADLKEDIPVTGGAKRPEFIHPDKLLQKYPALKEWSEKWSKILKREITPAAIKPTASK